MAANGAGSKLKRLEVEDQHKSNVCPLMIAGFKSAILMSLWSMRRSIEHWEDETRGNATSRHGKKGFQIPEIRTRPGRLKNTRIFSDGWMFSCKRQKYQTKIRSQNCEKQAVLPSTRHNLIDTFRKRNSYGGAHGLELEIPCREVHSEVADPKPQFAWRTSCFSMKSLSKQQVLFVRWFKVIF